MFRPCTLSERTYGCDGAPGADMCSFVLTGVFARPEPNTGSSNVTLSKNGLLATTIRKCGRTWQEHVNMPSDHVFSRYGIDWIESKCAEKVPCAHLSTILVLDVRRG